MWVSIADQFHQVADSDLIGHRSLTERKRDRNAYIDMRISNE